MRTFCLLLILVTCLQASIAKGQPTDLFGEIQNSFQTKPRASFKLDSRNAFVAGTPISTFGVKTGLQFGDRVNVGLGAFWLPRGFKLSFPETLDNAADLAMFYLAPYFEYSFIHRKNWLVTIPVQVGFGTSSIIYKPENTEHVRLFQNSIVLYEPAIIAEYMFLDYFGVGGGLGFRLMIKNNPQIDEQFNSPQWMLRFRVKFGKLLEDIQSQD